MRNEKVVKSRLLYYGVTLLVFSFFSFISILFLDMNKGDVQRFTVNEEMKIGPIHANGFINNYELSASKSDIHISGGWSTLRMDVLNEKGVYLFSMNEEFWYEKGRDHEGPWSEREGRLETAISLDKGVYYLVFEAEYSKGTKPSTYVLLRNVYGVSSIMKVMGYVTLILGVLFLSYNAD